MQAGRSAQSQGDGGPPPLGTECSAGGWGSLQAWLPSGGCSVPLVLLGGVRSASELPEASLGTLATSNPSTNAGPEAVRPR